MATIRAIASGDWTSSGTWFAGIGPVPGDVVIANGFNVNINGTFTVDSLRNDGATFGFTNNGTFTLANGSALTTTGSTGLFVPAGLTVAVLTFDLPFPQSASYNGSILTVPGGGAPGLNRIIQYNNSGTFNITGNFTIDSAASTGQPRCCILINGSGRVNILGDINSAATAIGTSSTLRIGSVANIFITSSIISGGPTTSGSSTTISSLAAANLDITCTTILGGNSPAIGLTGGGTLKIIATTITGGGGALATINNNTVAATMDITGAVTAGASSNAVNSLSSVIVVGNVTVPALGTAAAITTTGAVTVTGNVVTNGLAVGLSSGTLATIDGIILNNQQFQGVYAPRILIGTATTAMRYQTFSGATQLMFSSSAITLGQPLPNDVRLGTPYGLAPNDFVGTCIIPNPNTVVLGAPTDNTVGTLQMSPAAVVAELGTSTLDIAVRLQNVSTVQTMGEQAATYGI